nr:immunoglobulin light chain junction region [Macaca mulatta]
CMQGLEYPLTS